MGTFLLCVLWFVIYSCWKESDIYDRGLYIDKRYSLTCIMYGHWWIKIKEEKGYYSRHYMYFCPCCGSRHSDHF